MAALLVPICVVLGTGVFSVAPGEGIWHGLVTDLPPAWRAFLTDVAPVPELPGLVLAVAWTAGVAALLAELLASSRKVPRALSLAPAFAIYLFASALGRGSWGAIGLGAIAGTACWYLVATACERRDLMAGSAGAPDKAGSTVPRESHPPGRGAIVRLSVLAAVAAAVVGPNLPGARSAALVAWHVTGGVTGGVNSTAVTSGGVTPKREIVVSTLVQVAEEEIDDPSVALFTVHSPRPTREMIAALDQFNGSYWSTSPSDAFSPLASFPISLAGDERETPPLRAAGLGKARLVQVFDVDALGGHDIPTFGDVVAVANAGRVSEQGPGGSVVSDTRLVRGSTYAVASIVPDRFAKLATREHRHFRSPVPAASASCARPPGPARRRPREGCTQPVRKGSRPCAVFDLL